MIDYFAHIAVFERVRTGLVGVTEPDLLDARDNLLADAAAYPEAALLGTFVDHLLMHSASTGAEIEILGRAADLWMRGFSLYDSAGSVRMAIEGAFANPTAPGAAASFNNAMATFIGLRAKLADIQAGMDAIGSDATKWKHLPNPHPRQRDLPISQWDWGDRFLACRTDAFVRAAFKHAKNRRASAFALGALASYAGNVGGSAYLGHVVGGPRRTHPRRDRIARNTVGAWMRANRTLPDLQTLEADIHRNGSAGSGALRPDLESFLQETLKEAFPNMPSANLSVGLARLEKHLALLAVFVLPPMPVPPSPTLLATMSSLSSDGSIDFTDPPQQDPGNAPYGPPPPTGPDPSPTIPSQAKDESSANGCLIGLAIVTALYFLIDGIVALAQKKKYDPFGDLAGANTGSPSEDGSVAKTSQMLVDLSSSSGGTLMIAEALSFQMNVWQGMAQALDFLARKGLVYPYELTIGGLPYSQFTALQTLSSWPLRSEVAINEDYLRFPLRPIEEPSATASPFPVGATPFVFVDEPLVPTFPALFQSAPGEALRIWREITLHTKLSPGEQLNYDLDADRGYHAPCWRVAEKTSIHDDPVTADVLPYTKL
jgi:hypothetical protein